MKEHYGASADPAENLARARRLWKFAEELTHFAPVWGASSKAGHAHTVAAAGLYGLSQAICDVEGVSLTSCRSARPSGVENALRENLLELVRTRGLEAAAQLAYRLADGIATGEVGR